VEEAGSVDFLCLLYILNHTNNIDIMIDANEAITLLKKNLKAF